MSVVMIGAFMVVTGTIESQAKLEKVITKGFTHLNYSGKGFPLHPPSISYVNRAGWFRIPSSFAINPETKAVAGSLVTRGVNFTVSQADLAVDTPKWTKCESDSTIRVKCSEFINGEANVSVELNTVEIPPSAIVRLRTEWPSLPTAHPNKYSPEYVMSVPFIRDCDVTEVGPNIPKYLEHGGQYRTSAPPELPGKCETNWTIYTCNNGALTSKPFTKVCN